MLEITIIHNGEGLTVLDTQEKDQSAIGPSPDAIFVLGLKLSFPVSDQHVRLHANGEDAQPSALTKNDFRGAPSMMLQR